MGPSQAIIAFLYEPLAVPVATQGDRILIVVAEAERKASSVGKLDSTWETRNSVGMRVPTRNDVVRGQKGA